ncbi:hypothetical protein NDU88_006743 [Pleurodeles waltl]|uniref:Uncharacterized protein n=1 Tax=Pleurodeles waltl TaxID=8319 RepID=A0AAV7UMD0_PLEWA|nr:hypothetical protein NDU88_006743 [Pleurodeles waltl]
MRRGRGWHVEHKAERKGSGLGDTGRMGLSPQVPAGAVRCIGEPEEGIDLPRVARSCERKRLNIRELAVEPVLSGVAGR